MNKKQSINEGPMIKEQGLKPQKNMNTALRVIKTRPIRKDGPKIALYLRCKLAGNRIPSRPEQTQAKKKVGNLTIIRKNRVDWNHITQKTSTKRSTELRRGSGIPNRLQEICRKNIWGAFQ